MHDSIGFFRRFKLKLAPFLIKSSLMLNSSALTAAVLSWTAGRIRPRRGQRMILVLYRSIFIDDVKAMARFSGKFDYRVIMREHLQLIMKHCFSKEELAGLGETTYHFEKNAVHGKSKYYGYLNAMFPVLKKILHFEAILSGNFGYIEQQELARVAEAHGVPFVVLHKEGMDVFKNVRSLYKNYRFIGTKMLLYNEWIRDEFLNLPLSGLTAEKAVLVGIPRLDKYFFQSNVPSASRQIALFSFYPPSYFSHLLEDKERYQEAEKRSEAFHYWVMDFAKKNPSINVVIKTKVPAFYLDYVEKIRDKYFSSDIPNLRITNHTNATALILDSFAVLGFNSTTLIEALVADKIVLCPDFRDLFIGKNWDYFGEHPDLVNYIVAQKDMDTCLKNPEYHKKYTENTKHDFLKKLIFIPDGQASLRAEGAIAALLPECVSDSERN